jgi:hypothetical protein
MKVKFSAQNIFAVLFSVVLFWYAKYSYVKGYIGLRASEFHLDKNPLMFWSAMTYVCGLGVYLLYLVITGKGENVN